MKKQRQPKREPEKIPDEQPDVQPPKDSKPAFSLYTLLEVEKTATIDEIKRSYKKLVLKVHPDKNKEDPEAKDKFAKLTEAYQILTDPARKAEYDETGQVGDQFNLSAFESAYVYFRQIYKKIEEADIDDFAKKYIGGEMESEDLVNFYQSNKGDVTRLLEHIPLSKNSDIERFVKFFEDKIAKGQLTETRMFKKTKKSIKLLPDEEKEAQKQLKQMKDRGMQALVQVIRGKNGNKKDFLEALEKKYAMQGEEKNRKSKPKSLDKPEPKRNRK